MRNPAKPARTPAELPNFVGRKIIILHAMPLPFPAPTSTLDSLAVQYGTPYQLYDERQIRENCRALITAFRSQFGPTFRQYFAVKALPNPAILKILVEEGCGLDCSSTSELHIAAALGVTGGDVMYTSNYTSKSDLAMARELGVVINLDDASLVGSLAGVKGGGMPPLISFRLNPGLGRTDSETPSNVLGGPEAKFGVPMEQVVGAYRAAKEAGATRFGMHMMTGSCVMNEEYWQETVCVLLDAVAQVQRECGIPAFEFINIGGGLGIPYRANAPVVDVAALAQRLKATMVQRWGVATGGSGQPMPALYMENGRYMTGPFGWLVSRCHAVKKAWGGVYYGLDSCMANLMRPGMYGSYHHITVPGREGKGERSSAHVVGTLCENNDWFAKDRDLPVSSVGDLFVIHDTGAHSHSMGFQYNGKLRAPELLLRESGGVDLIRTRETIPILYTNAVMPQDLAATLPKSYPYLGASISGGTGFLPTFKLWHAALGVVAFAAGSLSVFVAGRSRK